MEIVLVCAIIALVILVVSFGLVSQKSYTRSLIIENLERENENLIESLQNAHQEKLETDTDYMNERKQIEERNYAMVYYLTHTILKNEKARVALEQQDEEEFKRVWAIAYDRIKEISDTQLEQELRDLSGDGAGFNYYGVKVPLMPGIDTPIMEVESERDDAPEGPDCPGDEEYAPEEDSGEEIDAVPEFENVTEPESEPVDGDVESEGGDAEIPSSVTKISDVIATVNGEPTEKEN